MSKYLIQFCNDEPVWVPSLYASQPFATLGEAYDEVNHLSDITGHPRHKYRVVETTTDTSGKALKVLNTKEYVYQSPLFNVPPTPPSQS